MAAETITGPGVPAGKGSGRRPSGWCPAWWCAVSSTARAYSTRRHARPGRRRSIFMHGPGDVIVSFLPMLCIAYAFRELNDAEAGLRDHLHVDDPRIQPLGRVARRAQTSSPQT